MYVYKNNNNFFYKKQQKHSNLVSSSSSASASSNSLASTRRIVKTIALAGSLASLLEMSLASKCVARQQRRSDALHCDSKSNSYRLINMCVLPVSSITTNHLPMQKSRMMTSNTSSTSTARPVNSANSCVAVRNSSATTTMSARAAIASRNADCALSSVRRCRSRVNSGQVDALPNGPSTLCQ